MRVWITYLTYSNMQYLGEWTKSHILVKKKKKKVKKLMIIKAINDNGNHDISRSRMRLVSDWSNNKPRKLSYFHVIKVHYCLFILQVSLLWECSLVSILFFLMVPTNMGTSSQWWWILWINWQRMCLNNLCETERYMGMLRELTWNW